MMTVLVTGPIGGGKSTVCKYLESKGFPVYDCDSRCKLLYDSVPGLKERIESELGIAFSELGRIFSDHSLRDRLEAIVYPLLLEDLDRWKAGLHGPLAFIESAIALDKPQFDGSYDSVLMITARRSIRFKRNAHARERDPLQTFDVSKADYIILNNASVEELFGNVDIYLKKFI